jgi:parallel beta-helix repeat protein
MNRRSFLNLFGLAWLTSTLPLAFTKSVGGMQLVKTSSKEMVFYVAPNGNDAWSGSKPSSQGKKGPFATIARARDAVRQLKQRQGGLLKQPVRVLVRGGTYFTEKTIDFTDVDSGTKDSPIIYQSYKNETPIISGGKLIKNWTIVKINNKVAWTTTLPEVNQGKWAFHQLWVNGNRAQRCRYPKKGYLKVEKSPDITPDWTVGQGRFHYNPGDLKAWQDLPQGEITILSRWLESRLSVKQIDEAQRMVVLSEPTPISMEPGTSSSSGATTYYLENIIDFLTEPGEWYLNRKTGQLFYLPLPGERLTNSTFIAPVLPVLLSLTGTPQTGNYVEYLSFTDIQFSHGEWYYPAPNALSPVARSTLSGRQASAEVPAFISNQYSRFCRWQRCVFSHIGQYAVSFDDSCNHNEINNSRFYDLGAGAIKIGSTQTSSPGHHAIRRCHIHDGGIIFHSAVGIWIGKSSHNLISHNCIHDFYYSGISVGWTWVPTKQPEASHNTIEFNHIYHIGQKHQRNQALLNDKGGIYILGAQPGTLIQGNKIHDISAYNFGAWGIYLDAESSHITVKDNLVYDTRDGGFHLTYGHNNVITHNIFAFGKFSQLRFTQGKKNSTSFTFQNNIVYWKEGTLLAGEWQHLDFVMDRNVYWHEHKTKRSINFGDLSWSSWNAQGMDKASRNLNPLFRSPAQRDFRLNPGSPATKFKNFPILNLSC